MNVPTMESVPTDPKRSTTVNVVTVAVQKLSTIPGDTVFVRVPPSMSSKDRSALYDCLRHNLPRGVKMIIHADPIEISVVSGELPPI